MELPIEMTSIRIGVYLRCNIFYDKEGLIVYNLPPSNRVQAIKLAWRAQAQAPLAVQQP